MASTIGAPSERHEQTTLCFRLPESAFNFDATLFTSARRCAVFVETVTEF